VRGKVIVEHWRGGAGEAIVEHGWGEGDYFILEHGEEGRGQVILICA
jgi:hypothetical protein